LIGREKSGVVVIGSAYPGGSVIIATGYLNYIDYVFLLLSADTVLLPYPSRAIRGSVRNKVLEAGYAGKPIVSTKYEMLFLEEAKPWIHYIPLEDIVEKPCAIAHGIHKQAVLLRELVTRNYSFSSFKKILLLAKMIIKEPL